MLLILILTHKQIKYEKHLNVRDTKTTRLQLWHFPTIISKAGIA
jgi:hypothetical protein